MPFLKYPATPPAVGNADTIGDRTTEYFVFLLVSVARRGARRRCSASRLCARGRRRTPPSLAGVGGYLVVVVVAGQLMPTVNEVGDFPADTLWYFRRASLFTLATLWAVHRRRAHRPGRPALPRRGRPRAAAPRAGRQPVIAPPVRRRRRSRPRAERLAGLATPPGALGRLGDLAVWLAATQGAVPPRRARRRPAGDLRRRPRRRARTASRRTRPRSPRAMVRTFVAGQGRRSPRWPRPTASRVRVLDLGVDDDLADVPDDGAARTRCAAASRRDPPRGRAHRRRRPGRRSRPARPSPARRSPPARSC